MKKYFLETKFTDLYHLSFKVVRYKRARTDMASSKAQANHLDSNTLDEEESGQAKVYVVEFTNGQHSRFLALKKPKKKEGFK